MVVLLFSGYWYNKANSILEMFLTTRRGICCRSGFQKKKKGAHPPIKHPSIIQNDVLEYFISNPKCKSKRVFSVGFGVIWSVISKCFGVIFISG